LFFYVNVVVLEFSTDTLIYDCPDQTRLESDAIVAEPDRWMNMLFNLLIMGAARVL
jgi:hypothetical protein